MDRRAFMSGLGALALGASLEGCSNQGQAALKVRLLKGSIPPQVLSQFRQFLRQHEGGNYKLDFAAEAQLRSLFSLLQTWQNTSEVSPGPWFWGRSSNTARADLVTLGDFWLAQAIQQQLIQPLDLSRVPSWQTLPARWQALVKRDRQGNPNLQGSIWGAPYRWGSTVITYRQDIFKSKGWQPPTDWADLWRPELRSQISLPDQPREVIGLVLKRLNQSYNTLDLTTVPSLKATLQTLHQQVKLYSSNTYLQSLILGDTALAVGWSTDVLPLIQSNRQIAAVVPASGTALWADLWVRPVSPQTSPAESSFLPEKWIDFCWQRNTAQQLALLSKAASPMLTELQQLELPRNALQQNSVLFPPSPVIERSEFLQPLPDKTLKQYANLWTEVRQVRFL